MALLDTIATSTAATAPPSAKFIGRPSRQCPKCKSIRHWVNTMGGVQCSTCQPAPDSLTDLAGRKIIAVAGIWEHDDGSVISATAAVESLQPQGSVSRDSLDGFDVSQYFVSPGEHGAILTNVDTGELIFQKPFVGKWLHDEQELVSWFLELSNPANREQFAHLASRIQGQWLSRWEFVNDATAFLTDWRAQLQLGPSGPRNYYGALLSDLRELYRWLLEHPDPKQQNKQPQDVTFSLPTISPLDLLAGLTLTL